MKNFQDLDPNKALFQGDFGQGIYLTDEYAIAKKYATNKYTLFQGEPFRRKWCNNNLDIIYNKALNCSKDTEFFYDELVTDDGRKFKIKVYPHRNESWCNALWDGWVNFKRQDCDIVIGCLSRKTMVDYILDLDNKVTSKRLTLNTAKDYLYSFCNEEKIRPVFQICIYKKEIIKYFKRF